VPYENWRKEIIECMATTEAVIDFGEDENIEDGVLDEGIGRDTVCIDQF
jgi:tRNA modification GTPase